MKVVLLFLVPFVLAQTPVTRAIPGTAGRMIKSADLREHLAVLRRGKTLGTADRGKSARHQWGAFFFLSLPKSQIEMDLPIISNFPVSPQPDAGLRAGDFKVMVRVGFFFCGTDLCVVDTLGQGDLHDDPFQIS